MLTTRLARLSDAELITAHRRAMFEEMGKSTGSALDEMSRNFAPWVMRMMESDRYAGWVILDEDRPVASAGFFALEWPPHPLDPRAAYRGYLLNFWVDRDYRRRGLAQLLVKESLAEAKRRGLHVVALHASDAGRPVYESMGFRATNEMYFIDEVAP
jgi:GNAT superfamily N-acetyltransferase